MSVVRLFAVIFTLSVVSFFQLAQADETLGSAPSNSAPSSKKLSKITVVGSGEGIDKIPGSVHLIDKKELDKDKAAYDDVHRILRQIPGVNVQEEDGYGLRPNIGFRGVSVERSAKITLMEDGVLIAPAPYSAPSAYYFPITGRMESLEVTKGPGQIKYGPQTVAGALNLLSTSIPDEFSFNANIKTGQGNTRIAHVNVGNSLENFGFLLETYQAVTDGFKQLDSGGDSGYDLEDYIGKIRVNSDPNAEIYQELEVKLGRYDQLSDETYLGLTQADFDMNPYRRYSASQLDQMDVNHDQLNVNHYVAFSDQIDLNTTFYYNETRRNWFKLQSVGGESIADVLDDPSTFGNEYSYITGVDSPDNTLVVRANNREYESQGIQTALGLQFDTGAVAHDLEFGVRYHEDEEDRFQHDDAFRMDNAVMVLTSAGAPGSNANRIGEAEAWAFHLQDTAKWQDFTFTPGIRVESIDYRRTDYGKEDPSRSGVDMSVNDSDVSAVIPGGGVHYQINQEFGTFVGIHKGFSPPGPQTSANVKEEESVNLEIGGNYNSGNFNSEVVWFHSDYDNLLGADSLSAGGEGTGDLFNAGQATTWGFETAASYLFENVFDSGLNVPTRMAYTLTNAEFDDSFDSDLFGLVDAGDDIPYIPKNQLHARIGVESEEAALYLGAHFVDAMQTAAGQSGIKSSDKTDSYFVFDLTGEVGVAENTKIFASVQNLLDEEYVVARRPAGARPGLPQTFLAGVKINLG